MQALALLIDIVFNSFEMQALALLIAIALNSFEVQVLALSKNPHCLLLIANSLNSYIKCICWHLHRQESSLLNLIAIALIPDSISNGRHTHKKSGFFS